MGRMEECQAGSGRATMPGIATAIPSGKEATDQVLRIARRDGQQIRLNYRQPQEGDPHKGDRAVKRRRRDNTHAKSST